VPAEKFARLGIPPVHLAELSRMVGEQIAGRTGGAVSLAVGFAQIFSGLPLLKGLMSYWYHFAIMFEALFILTTIDTGTRVGRFMVQEFLSKAFRPFENPSWLPGTLISTFLVVFGWSYFILTGSISHIWPMFGIANQLLACVALCVGTTVIINSGKLRYAWTTMIPLGFISSTTTWAAIRSIFDNFLPLTHTPGKEVQGWIDTLLTLMLLIAVFVILIASARAWIRTVRGGTLPLVPAEATAAADRQGPGGCC
jgi:carbon starvation protein